MGNRKGHHNAAQQGSNAKPRLHQRHQPKRVNGAPRRPALHGMRPKTKHHRNRSHRQPAMNKLHARMAFKKTKPNRFIVQNIRGNPSAIHLRKTLIVNQPGIKPLRKRTPNNGHTDKHDHRPQMHPQSALYFARLPLHFGVER